VKSTPEITAIDRIQRNQINSYSKIVNDYRHMCISTVEQWTGIPIILVDSAVAMAGRIGG